jgi:hypothetical protein
LDAHACGGDHKLWEVADEILGGYCVGLDEDGVVGEEGAGGQSPCASGVDVASGYGDAEGTVADDAEAGDVVGLQVGVGVAGKRVVSAGPCAGADELGE